MGPLPALLRVVSAGLGIIAILLIFKMFDIGWYFGLSIIILFLSAIAIGLSKWASHISKRK